LVTNGTFDNNEILAYIRTNAPATSGALDYRQAESGTYDFVRSAGGIYEPGANVVFNFAGRNGSTFVNAASNGTALTANTAPTALADLSAADLNLAPTFMGTISQFRIWADDLADAGIEEATTPSTEPSLNLVFAGGETSFIVEDWT
jgi:hypothetical protein